MFHLQDLHLRCAPRTNHKNLSTVVKTVHVTAEQKELGERQLNIANVAESNANENPRDDNGKC